MRAGAGAATAVALLLIAAAALGPSGPALAQYDTPQQEEPAQKSAPEPQQKESGGGGDDDPSGPPIWAGIALRLVAAGAGTLLARARNRRRMRGYPGD